MIPKLPIEFEFDHVGIAVKSLEEGRKFYETMGLRESKVEVVEREKVKVEMFYLGNDSKVELLEPTSPESAVAKFIDKRGPGIHHICLRVKDVKKALANLKLAGYKLINEEPFRGAHDCWVAFIHPSSTGGVLLELSQQDKGALK